LAERLRRRLRPHGSTLFTLTWQRHITPSGLAIYRLRASAPRIDASDCTSWPTTTTQDSAGSRTLGYNGQGFMTLTDAAQMASWKTPNCPRAHDNDRTAGAPYPSKMQMDLPEQAWLANWNPTGPIPGCFKTASWPSPTTPSGGQTSPEGTTATGRTPDGRKVQVTLKDVASLAAWGTSQANNKMRSEEFSSGRNPNLEEGARLTSWPTPTTKAKAGGEYTDSEKAITRAMGPHANDLRDFVHLASWPTPMAGTPAQNGNNEAGNTDSSRKTVSLALSVGPARLTASGELLTGSSAETLMVPNGVRLNPSMSRWLMSLPEAWDTCAPVKPSLKRK
jgi:hypothetical protein